MLDSKGRLFGKINVLDFLVLLFIVCLLPIIPFGIKIYQQQKTIHTVPMVAMTKVDYDKIIHLYEIQLSQHRTEYEAKLEARRIEYEAEAKERQRLEAWQKRLFKEHERLRRF